MKVACVAFVRKQHRQKALHQGPVFSYGDLKTKMPNNTRIVGAMGLTFFPILMGLRFYSIIIGLGSQSCSFAVGHLGQLSSISEWNLNPIETLCLLSSQSLRGQCCPMEISALHISDPKILALRGLFVFFSFSKQQSVFQIHNHHHSPQAGCRLQNSRGQLTGGSVGVCHNEHQNSTYSTHDNKASRWYRWRRPTGPSRCVYSEPPTGWPSHTLLGNWGVNLWHGSSNQIE